MSASSESRRWNIFFSSCFTDAGDTYLAIRERVRATFNSATEKPIWMGEDFAVLDPHSPAAPIEKALFCVKGVRYCDAYVAVIIDKHGSGVELGSGQKTQASFLELELFEAAISQKPAFIFVLKDHEPKGRMAALLDLLAPALPGLCREPLDEDEIMIRVERILQSTRHPWLARLGRFTASNRIAQARLSASRHRPYRPRSQLPALKFLDDPYDPTLGRPSVDVVQTLLTSVETYDDHQSKLAIIWLALRELMGTRPTRAKGDELLHCWDVALAKWTSSAAWYGLHGFCLMGCLGAISSRARILRKFSGPRQIPHGAFASEYYSIAKGVGDRRLREAFLELALDHIEIALRKEETPGALAIRGSIYWRLGRRPDGIADYERVTHLREMSGAPAKAVGEAKAELGFALLHDRSTRDRGLALLQEGVEIASQGPPDGFLVRAKRKLGLGYLTAAAPRRALHEFVNAYDMAVEHSLFDQIGRVERVAKQVDLMLPFLQRPN